MEQPNGRRPSGSRCIALVGPYLSGKTTLLEAILFSTGAIPRQGKVSDKSTVGDAAPEARAHGMSIELNAATTAYLGDSYTFLDCPGSIEFAQDQRAALLGCDLAIVVCEADDKKAPALQLILKQLDEIGLPRMLFINKVDKSDTRPRDVLEWLQPASSKPLIMRQLPIMKGSIVTGFVDLALERAFIYQEHLESKLIDMPEDIAALEKTERFAMLEKLADHDDELMEQLLSDMEPPRDRVFSDLARELAEGLIVPVLFGSAEHGEGIERLLKALRHEAPGVAETAKRLGLKANGTTVQVLKTFHTAHGGKLSLSRVLAGDVADGAVLHGATGHDMRVAGVFTLLGSTPNKVAKAGAGDTIALGRLEGARTGETLSSTKGNTPQLVKVEAAPGVYGFAIAVSDRKDEVKLTSAIAKLVEEDPSLSLDNNHDTHEMVLWGQGEMHLRVAIEKLEGKFGVHAKSKPRRIASRRRSARARRCAAATRSNRAAMASSAMWSSRFRPCRAARASCSPTRSPAAWCRSNIFLPSNRACASGWGTGRWALPWSISRSTCLTARITMSTRPKWRSRRRRALPWWRACRIVRQCCSNPLWESKFTCRAMRRRASTRS